MTGCWLAWIGQTVRANAVPGGIPHAQHQIVAPMEVNPNGTWIRGMPRRRSVKLVLDWPRAPNPIIKDMLAKKSSRLEDCNVWLARLFPNDVFSDNDDSNDGGACSGRDRGGGGGQ